MAEADDTSPGDNDIVIKVGAQAVHAMARIDERIRCILVWLAGSNDRSIRVIVQHSRHFGNRRNQHERITPRNASLAL